MANRGRPPLRSDADILDAALSAFAEHGYGATSVRALNAALGLSHETISQRFGTKPSLYRAAVAHGLERFVREFDDEIKRCEPGDDLGRLRATVRALMVATSCQPALGALLHQEGFDLESRDALIADAGIRERLLEVADLLADLHAQGCIEATSLRQLWFLAEGGSSPLHFAEFAGLFDPIDGPVDPEQLLDTMTDAIMRSMGVGITGGR